METVESPGHRLIVVSGAGGVVGIIARVTKSPTSVPRCGPDMGHRRCGPPAHIFHGLLGEDLDRIFNNQPVYFDGLGYVPHWFEKQDIRHWGKELCHKQQVGKTSKKVQQKPQN